MLKFINTAQCSKGRIFLELTERQARIVEIVKQNGQTAITGDEIANRLSVAKATLRSDMSILTMCGLLDSKPRVGYSYSGKRRYRFLSEQLHQAKVGDLKSVPIVLAQDCSVENAIVTMMMEDVGTLFVVRDGGYLEGILSRKDLLKIAVMGKDIKNLPVSIYMTRMPNVITVEAEEPVLDAARKIIEHEVDALPVVRIKNEKDLEVIGRFSKTNIVRLFVELGGEC